MNPNNPKKPIIKNLAVNTDLNNVNHPDHDNYSDQFDEVNHLDPVRQDDRTESNPDPITGQPGSHPLGTGVGAAGAGAAATVIGGIVGGPVGAVVGAVVGSVAGGLAGKSTAENMNPTSEDNWTVGSSRWTSGMKRRKTDMP